MRVISSALSLFLCNKPCLIACAIMAGLMVVGCVAEKAMEGAPQSTAKARMEEGETQPSSSPGSYLAGLHAERHGKAGPAGDFLLHALAADPENLSLLNRAFLLMVEEGRFDEATSLAERVLDINPEATLPILTLAMGDVIEGDLHLAEVKLRSLPEEGFNKFLKPLILSWVLLGQGLELEAEMALTPLSENSGFAVLRDLHLGLIRDVSGDEKKAMESYENAFSSGFPSSFRIVEIFGNFFERSGHSEKASEIYRNYLETASNAYMIEPALARLENNKKPETVVGSVRDGMAEALFNIAGALHQEDAAKMALIYSRLAGFLRPDFPINQALLAEIYELQGRKESAKSLYETIRPGTPHRWMADLRVALILDELDRTEEALAALRALANDRPDSVESLVSMGDILRTSERFKEAIAAYDEAVARIDEMEKRHWALLYARGIALERAKLWQRPLDDRFDVSLAGIADCFVGCFLALCRFQTTTPKHCRSPQWRQFFLERLASDCLGRRRTQLAKERLPFCFIRILQSLLMGRLPTRAPVSVDSSRLAGNRSTDAIGGDGKTGILPQARPEPRKHDRCHKEGDEGKQNGPPGGQLTGSSPIHSDPERRSKHDW